MTDSNEIDETRTDQSRTADGPGADDAVKSVYATMRHLVLESDDRRRAVVDATGMSFARAKALRYLAPKPLRMTELASILFIDKPYTTLIVDDLERRGLVVRTVAENDRRSKVVTLTDDGRALAATAEDILTRTPAVFEMLDADELADLVRIFAKLQ
jgi:DNA-binding MarR family transcriptional regulator